MTRYMLAVHSTTGEPRSPLSEDEMRRSHEALAMLESEMQRTGAWVFSGRLSEPDAASVVSAPGTELLVTDGPFAESKEQLGGFYIIDADDHDAALTWAGRVTRAVGAPIEVRAFAAFAGS